MNSAVTVEMRVGTLAKLKENPEQLNALVENVLREGQWETADHVVVWYDFDSLMVIPKANGERLLVIGIEKDGYTHS